MSNKSSQKTLSPNLRFSEFRNIPAWKEEPLGKFLDEYREKSTVQDEHEVLTSARDGLIRQKDYYGEGRITERDNVGFNVIPPNHITYRSRSDDRRFFFNENNLGITGIISTYYPVFTIKGGCNKFFLELCSRYTEEIGKRSVGNAQTVLSFNELKKIKLPIPKPDEQQKIADCLSSIDELIVLEAQKLGALKEHKTGFKQLLFPAEGEMLPQYRFAEFKDAPAWEEKPLGKVFTRIKTKNAENNLNCLTISAQDGLVSQLDYFNKKISAKDLTGYYLLHKGDFAYNKSYSQGYPMGAIKRLKFYDKGVVSSLYICFKVQKGYSEDFFEYFFDHGMINSEIAKVAQEGARNHGLLNIGVNDFFDSVNVKFPKLKEQQKIADCLSAVDDLITAQFAKVEALKKHKKGLMQQLFPAATEVTG